MATVTVYVSEEFKNQLHNAAEKRGTSVAAFGGHMLEALHAPEYLDTVKVEQRGTGARISLPAKVMGEIDWRGSYVVSIERSGNCLIVRPLK
jgi:hypothetical protein